MPDFLRDMVIFRGDKLFNGAVNIGWFGSDEARTKLASSAFIFHGPTYHGVSQTDVGFAHGHRLQDTASFVRSIMRRCYGLEDQPFTLAIAGYGTGKSHLGLTLSSVLSRPTGDTAEVVLKGIDGADRAIGSEVRAILSEARQPCLVVALNGMQNFDLTSEVTRQIFLQIKAFELDTRPLDELRPRFAQAVSLIRMAADNSDVINELVTACGVVGIEDILTRLEQQDDLVYSKVHQVLASKNIRISALGGESVRDVIDVAVREYCGIGKTFKSLVVLFDEFGRYTEFASVKSHIAGSGVLQDLFEGIQANAGAACLVGFIQFELNAYVQRVAPEHRNEILRYVSRYQAANRVYLSINLETLIASLIEKVNPERLDQLFDNETAKRESEKLIGKIERWFPQSGNYRLWKDPDQFHGVIRKGCWPLSAYSTWFLFHLAAAGKHLQERSALALLGDTFDRFKNFSVNEDSSWSLSPVDFWSDTLQQEFITAEEGGQQGSITHAYATVEARHGAQLDDPLKKLLRAAVLASKMGLKASDRNDAVRALSEIAGLNWDDSDRGIRLLQDEYNVVEWDDAFKTFDILGDAVPRTQFLSFVRQRVASTYDEAGKGTLFASKAGAWCDLLGDLDCDFAEENKITTREWRYTGVTSNLNLLPMQVKLASDRWKGALEVDKPRGTIIYCYVEPSRDIEAVAKDTAKLLKTEAKDAAVSAQPILIVLIYDEDGVLGQSLAELAVLDESISADDRARFGNLISGHREKKLKVVRSQVESMIRSRLYITAFKDPLETHRLSRAGTELFARIYKSVVVFPFDGFSTAKGNAADSCQELTTELLLGKLDYDAVMGKPIKIKNRAVSVLKDAWGIFSRNGSVSRRPRLPILKALTEKWDEMLASGERRITVGDAIRGLCVPPYGANIASAGLFLGVYVAPRVEKLSIIRAGQPLAISQWVKDGIFRGKFVDLGPLHEVYLIHTGEESSEWETLLDEWELAESHLGRVTYLERASELKTRVPVPPTLGYRLIHLETKSRDSKVALDEMEKKQSDAIERIIAGAQRSDVGLLSWGASDLLKLINRMTEEKPQWTEDQIEELRPKFEQTRQGILQCFPDWLKRQAPKSIRPDDIGEFKHKMIRVIGGSINKIALDNLYIDLEVYTLQILRNVETVAETNQLIREVRLWLESRCNITHFVRVAELRDLQKEGKEFASKLKGLSSRINMTEIGDVRLKLSEALNRMKDAEKNVQKRAEKLWGTKLRTTEDIDSLQAEVEALIGAYENCPHDIEDLQLMRQVLRIYQNSYQRLSDERLSWPEFEVLAHECRVAAERALDEESCPWPPEDVIDVFVKNISKLRKEKSVHWIEELNLEAETLETMLAPEANLLHSRANNPPALITPEDSERLSEIVNEIEIRLDALKVDWMVEKFKELPMALRRKFLVIISETAGIEDALNA